MKLKSIFAKNGYPLDLLTRLITWPTQRDMPFGPKRCSVYLKLPWKGPWSSSMSRAIASAAQSAYFAVHVNCIFTTSRAFNLRKDVLPSHQQSNLIYEFECRHCVSRYVGRTAQRLSSRIRQHVPLHLLPEDSSARADRPTRGRPRNIPETQNLVPEATNSVEETLSGANETDATAQGTVPLAVACGESITTSDGANLTVVGDALSVAIEGTAAQADMEGPKLRPSLPRACKKSRTSQFQLTGELKGNPKPPTDEATPVVPASGAQVVDGAEERRSVRASLPRACKKTSDVKPGNTPSNLPAEKMKREKKPSDYQSAVARHLAENKKCAMAYSDSSFRVVRACHLNLNLEIMEALYIKALAPNLCVQKSSIAHLQLFRHR